MTKLFIDNPNKNNLGCVRLFAAAQVAVCHVLGAYDINNWFVTILNMIPGVPIFFFISGLLIAQSFEKSKSKCEFYKKRIRRIFPALYFQVAISLFLLVLSGYFNYINVNLLDVCILLATQLTIFQFYTPEFLKNYGVGSFNGIVWSIFIELQIYLIYPYISKIKNKNLLLIIVASYISNIYCVQSKNYELIKYLNITFLPWIYYFIAGVIQYRLHRIFPIINNRALILLIPIYFLLYNFFSKHDLGGGNYINPLCFMILIVILMKISFGFKFIYLNADISYGIYLYHMVFLNYFFYIKLIDLNKSIFLIMLFSIFFAYVSYKYIEFPGHMRKQISGGKNE